MLSPLHNHPNTLCLSATSLPGPPARYLPFPSSAMPFLWLHLCLALGRGRTQREKQHQEFVQALVFTGLLVERRFSFPQDFRYLHADAVLTIATATIARLPGGWHRWGWKKEKLNRKASFSLWSLGGLFLLFRPERKLYLLSWSSFCLYMVHPSRLQAAFESRPANTGGEKMRNSTQFNCTSNSCFPL